MEGDHAPYNCKNCFQKSTTGASAGARLLKRVFDVDVEHCPNCGGALKIIAAIDDPPVIAKILTHLGLPTRARRVPRRVESIYSRRCDSRKPPANASRRPCSL